MSLLVLHAAVTWTMLGVILVVQVVHYPLFARVGTEGWLAYAERHGRRISLVVVPLMTVELVTAVALVARPPAGAPRGWLWVGLALLAIIWTSTATVQVPLHRRLARGFDRVAHRRLVATNWVRTACWTARGVLVGVLLLGGR